MIAVRGALLRWFHRHARSLPWRHDRTPYAVWVSEVMLQQTQVATVVPYFQRFMQRFPTVRHLGEAPLEKVLELWSGLGYYRRARHLHAGAQTVTTRFGGEFPRDYETMRSLPGIGEYTARAILSIAFNFPYYVLDGNVARVVSRFLALGGNLHQRGFRRSIEGTLEGLLPLSQSGDFNEALMELGQRVCLPRNPQCRQCPLQRWCRAWQSGEPEAFPEPKPRRARELHFLAAGYWQDVGKVGLVRGVEPGLLEDLWNFPSGFGDSRQEALRQLAQRLLALAGHVVEIGPVLATTRHNITHRKIQVSIHAARGPRPAKTRGWRWLSPARLQDAAISQLARKIAQAVQAAEAQLWLLD
jgi:A/G-specific adenine glycosylase